MSITNEAELAGMQKVSEAVAITLKEMRDHARPGMTTRELDDFGGKVLESFGARSAPNLTYGFPGHTCISLNDEIAHGIPAEKRVLKDGDLINVDVSAELNGFWSDNGGSFILGNDLSGLEPLVNASKAILKKAIDMIKGGVKISEIGSLIEKDAKRQGYKVIRNLGGHGIGRKLHEEPTGVLNYKAPSDHRRFRKNSVVAIETFITTASTLAIEQSDGFTLLGNKGGYSVQHEHTIVVTDNKPLILTEMNEIWV